VVSPPLTPSPSPPRGEGDRTPDSLSLWERVGVRACLARVETRQVATVKPPPLTPSPSPPRGEGNRTPDSLSPWERVGVRACSLSPWERVGVRACLACVKTRQVVTVKPPPLTPSPSPPRGEGDRTPDSLSPWERVGVRACSLSPWERVGVRACLARAETRQVATVKPPPLTPSPSPPRGEGDRTPDSLSPGERVGVRACLARVETRQVVTVKPPPLTPSPSPPRGEGDRTPDSLSPWERVGVRACSLSPWERAGVRACLVCVETRQVATVKPPPLTPSPSPPRGEGDRTPDSLSPWERVGVRACLARVETRQVATVKPPPLTPSPSPPRGEGDRTPDSLSPWERVGVRACSHRQLHPKQRLHTRSLGRAPEGRRAVQRVVIGQGQRGHLQLGRARDQRLRRRDAVQQGKPGVAVQFCIHGGLDCQKRRESLQSAREVFQTNAKHSI
jgi:hypothetical protein